MTTAEFSEQVASLGPTLRALTRRFTDDADDRADLVQDTLLKALTYRDKFRQDSNLTGWLFTIMRNTYINKYRKNQRTKTLHDTTKELYFINVEETHTLNLPERNFAFNEICENVDQLNEELLVPFKMHTSGYKYQEIADHLDIPLGTVKNRIFHARKEIQKKLAGY